MHNQQVSERKLFNNGNIKALIAAVVFHAIYSFIFGMLIGGKNAFIFLYEKDLTLLYMIITPLVFSIPYIISGYLITLARNTYKQLQRKNLNLFILSVTPILTVYIISFIAQYYFPYRDMLGFFIFINYPSASYLIAMELARYSQNLLVLLSVLFPPLMTLLGGYIRIKQLSRGDSNE